MPVPVSPSPSLMCEERAFRAISAIKSEITDLRLPFAERVLAPFCRWYIYFTSRACHLCSLSAVVPFLHNVFARHRGLSVTSLLAEKAVYLLLTHHSPHTHSTLPSEAVLPVPFLKGPAPSTFTPSHRHHVYTAAILTARQRQHRSKASLQGLRSV